MKSITIFILFLAFHISEAQIVFEKAYTLTSGTIISGRKIMQNDDETYTIMANVEFQGGVRGGSLVKTDSAGNVLWAKIYSDTSKNIVFTNFESSPGNEYLITGFVEIAGSEAMAIFKVDSLGNYIWSNCYGGNGSASFSNGLFVNILSDGNYLTGGYTSDYGNGSTDMYFIKTDISGNTLWAKTFGTSLFEVASAADVINGGIAIGGENYDKLALVILDNNGGILINKSYKLNGSNGITLWSLRKCPDNGFAFIGVWRADTSGFWPFLLKTDSNGTFLWCKLYTQAAPGIVGEFFDGRITSDGGFILTWEPEWPCQYCRTGLIKTDSVGNIEWAKNYSLNNLNFPHSAIQASDLGFAIIGDVTLPAAAGIEFVKTDQNGVTGCYDSTLIVVPINISLTTNTFGSSDSGYTLQSINPITTTLSLNDTSDCLSLNTYSSEIKNHRFDINIFPNPVNKILNVKTNDNTPLKLAIYDITSRYVYSTSFINSTEIDVEHLAIGIYAYVLSNNENVILRGKFIKD